MPDTLIAVYIVLGATGALLLILLRPPCVPLLAAVATGFKMIVLMIVALVFVWIVTSFTSFK